MSTETKSPFRRMLVQYIGLRTVFEAEDPDIDIIAVHGLGASPEWTWRQDKAQDWFENPAMLAKSLKGFKPRIFRFGYDSSWFGEKKLAGGLESISKALTRGINTEREDCPDRPLLFIAHCYGGLVVEQAIVRNSDLLDHCKGVVLLGTPHHGSNTFNKDGVLLLVLGAYQQMQYGDFHYNERILGPLQSEDNLLNPISQEFAEIANRNNLPVFCFFEQDSADVSPVLNKLNIPGLTLAKSQSFVVPESSAVLAGFECEGLPLDHFQLNKFSDPEDGNYRAVAAEIRKMCKTVKPEAKPQTKSDSRFNIGNITSRDRSNVVIGNSGHTNISYR